MIRKKTKIPFKILALRMGQIGRSHIKDIKKPHKSCKYGRSQANRNSSREKKLLQFYIFGFRLPDVG